MADAVKSPIAELRVDGKVLTLPILEDTAGFRATDIRSLSEDARFCT